MKEPNFDGIAKEYQESKKLSFRHYAEEHTLFLLLGDLPGKTVLDVACGEGIYSRKLKLKGAAQVVGIDISPKMIELARREEQRHPLGIQYSVKDAEVLEKMGEFDLVLASYLLNYARSKEQLLRFLKNLHLNLKKGGRLVGINDNPANSPEYYSTYKKYGFVKETDSQRPEGSPITYTFFKEDGTHFQFDNYFLKPETYEKAAEEAGFERFIWCPLEVSPAGKESMGEAFWKDFLLHPPLICFEALKT